MSDHEELLAPYRRPHRHIAAATWREQPELRRATVLAAALAAGGAIGVLAGEELLTLLLGLGAMIGAIVAALWLVAILRTGHRLRRSWDQDSELAAVRAHRPHAGELPDGAHEQFAVSAEADGVLVTWRFRPLRVGERPAEDEVEVPGRPRYAASPVARAPFAVADAARAAGQLVAAQAEAARREADAAELADEARGTAAALQRATGQRR